eukprot:5565654-Pyramimonas_sp.AAC.1
MLSTAYAFKSQKDPGTRPLWSSVRFELWRVASTLPLGPRASAFRGGRAFRFRMLRIVASVRALVSWRGP